MGSLTALLRFGVGGVRTETFESWPSVGTRSQSGLTVESRVATTSIPENYSTVAIYDEVAKVAKIAKIAKIAAEAN